MIFYFIEDLLHFEGCRDSLEQDGGPYCSLGKSEIFFGGDEDIVPQSGFQVSFNLGKIKIRSRSFLQKLVHVVIKIQSKIKQGTGSYAAVHSDMTFLQMPPPRPHHQHRQFSVRPRRIDLPVGPIRIRDRSAHRIPQISLSLRQIAPGGRAGIFKIGHVSPCAGIEPVDDHLSIGRTGDLHPTVGEVGGGRGAGPGRVRADVQGFRRIRRETSAVKFESAGGPSEEEGEPTVVEFVAEVADEAEGVGGEHLGGGGAYWCMNFHMDGR
mmetsp:Transcript_34337/g.79416  ORF Transcript_34337/g.79416 Transcript_34337/m.79416 type:complete len:267 (+) Transcript_34337:1066-1866(+)